MLLSLSSSVLSIMLVPFFRRVIWLRCSMTFSTKFMNQLKKLRISVRKELFPFVTRFMDRRIDSYLSLYYECELYDLLDLKNDLCDLLYNPQCYSAVAFIEPVSDSNYSQLTLF